MVTINKHSSASAKRAFFLGLAFLTVAHGHLVMASNPFIRTDRALRRLTSMLDELVDTNGLPPQVQPLWRRVVQPQPQPQTDMTQSPLAFGADAAVLAFRAEALETRDSYVIQADLPGVKRENVRIAFHENNVLAITATRTNPYEALTAEAGAGALKTAAEEGKKDKGKGGASEVKVAQPSTDVDEAPQYPKYLMREVAYGKAARTFKLPSDASPETATARFEDGILTVIIKKREQPREKVIEIQ